MNVADSSSRVDPASLDRPCDSRPIYDKGSRGLADDPYGIALAMQRWIPELVAVQGVSSRLGFIIE